MRLSLKLVVSVLALSVTPLVSAAEYVAPRGPDGVRPDLNGIWQAMNEANYDLELHMARSALQEREGPHGPVPAKNVLAMREDCCLADMTSRRLQSRIRGSMRKPSTLLNISGSFAVIRTVS